MTDIHSCGPFCTRTACVSAREAEHRGQLGVMADLLDEAFAIIALVEPESSTEGAQFALLLDRMASAVRAVRMAGVDIDAVHRLTAQKT